MKLVVPRDLEPGMVILLPFDRSVVVEAVSVGKKYVTVQVAENDSFRYSFYDEVLIED